MELTFNIIIIIIIAMHCIDVSFSYDEGESRVVEISSGLVRGFKEDGVYAFYSIPYATAPSGSDRFKAPLPPSTWSDILDAVDHGIICPQHKVIPLEKLTMKEDCLIANVLVPDTMETNLPVVVFIHYGSYQFGFGNMTSAKNLVRSKGIVAVNFNYRLGPHGFLCLGTKDVPGNAGMKDQVALLRWVNINIDKFGGNPNDVSLLGISAGASAAELLMLSKTAKGLFNKVIPESGSSLAVWSVQMDPIENAKQYAKTFNFTNVDDIDALEQFFKNLPYELLHKGDFLTQPDSTFVFSPCVESDTGTEMFLDDAPINILKRGDYNKVPMLYGFTNMEGIFRVIAGYGAFVKGMNENFTNYLPADLEFDSEIEREAVAKRVKEFYFGDKTIGDETIFEFIDYFSDVVITYSILRAVKYHVEAGHDQIYLYEYSYPSNNTFPETQNMTIRGSPHMAQVEAIVDDFSLSNKEEFDEMRTLITDVWHQFFTTSNPVPTGSSLHAWPTADASRAPYMALALPPRLVSTPLLDRRVRFWDDIYERHYRTPAPPNANYM